MLKYLKQILKARILFSIIFLIALAIFLSDVFRLIPAILKGTAVPFPQLLLRWTERAIGVFLMPILLLIIYLLFVQIIRRNIVTPSERRRFFLKIFILIYLIFPLPLLIQQGAMAPAIEWMPFLGTVIIIQGLNLLLANFYISYAVYLPGYLTFLSFLSLFIFHFIVILIISLLIFRIIINLKTKRRD